MKLKYWRTICVGFAFFLICAFWQAYDNIIPKILTDKFGMAQGWSGVIMALDNVLALFMLPLFGAISDKCMSKYGRRTPFIVVGTVLAVVAFIGLSYIDGMQADRFDGADAANEKGVYTLYQDSEIINAALKTHEGEEYVLSEKYTREEMTAVCGRMLEGDKEAAEIWDEYYVPARQAYAAKVTSAHKSILIIFMLVLLVTLVSMSVFRSPAVALMPDVTIKPLRSKANAIINLMGSFGGILVLALGIVFGTGKAANAMMSYTTFFKVIGGVMILALVIFLLTVREPKFAREMEEETKRLGLDGNEGAGAPSRPRRPHCRQGQGAWSLPPSRGRIWAP